MRTSLQPNRTSGLAVLLLELLREFASRLVHSQPGAAGDDVGAEGPEDIAWAIVAEILAVSSPGTRAGFLRDRGGPIHPRAAMEAVG